MAIKFVVDTHALIWFLEGSATLGARAKEILSDTDSELVVSIITLAEACWIIERGRSGISSASEFLDAIDADRRIKVLPLDRAVLDITCQLTTIAEMHDRQIVATVLLLRQHGYDVQLVTKDTKIIAAGVVATAW